MNCDGQEAQVDRQFIVPRIPPPHQFRALLRLQFLTRTKLVECALALDEQRAVFAYVRELEHDVGHPEARGPQRYRVVVDGYASGGYEVFVRRKERCCSGKKASIDQPCVRSMVSSRRVGGGARSREIIHWMMGNIPVVG